MCVERSFTFHVAEESKSLGMDFVEPYLALPESFVDGLPEQNTNFGLNVVDWKTANAERNIAHTVEIRMRHEAFGDPDLELAFHGDGCDGAEVACSVEKCELMKAD